MSSKYLERRLNKIEERLLFVEENINQRIILLNVGVVEKKCIIL